jgi:protein-arginine kinase activator protein McsA
VIPREIFDGTSAPADDAAVRELCRIDCDELSDLKNELRRAVREEKYERAAELRDKINTLQKKKDA